MKKLIQKQKRAVEQFIVETKKADEVLRVQVILMLDDGDGFAKIHHLTGFSRTHAFRLRREYVGQGIAALKDKRKGTPKELLTKKQRDEIIHNDEEQDAKRLRIYSGLLDNWIPRAMD